MIIFNIFFINIIEEDKGKNASGEEEIKKKIEEGDYGGAIEEIIDKYKGSIFNFVYFNLNIKADAEDITQEIFVKVWENIKKFKFESSIKTWLFNIARNTIINEKKKVKRKRKKSMDLEGKKIEKMGDLAGKNAKNPEERVIEEERNIILEKFLKEHLCDEQREIFYLKEIEGMSWEEIAKKEKKSINALRTAYSRKLEKLRKAEEYKELCNIFKEFLSNKEKEEK